MGIMTTGEHARADAAGPWPAAASPAEPGPFLIAQPDAASRTGLIVFPRPDALPAAWAGAVPVMGIDPGDAARLLRLGRPGPLLPEHAAGWFGRPGLSGHRLHADGGRPAAGRDWSPLFRPTRYSHDGTRARIEAEDAAAGLRLVTEIEAVPGGAIRGRHTVTNTGRQPYVTPGSTCGKRSTLTTISAS